MKKRTPRRRAKNGQKPTAAPCRLSHPARALRRAVRLLGSQTQLARVVGRAQPSVWAIVTKKRDVPAPWCRKIETATGGKVTAHELRPDLYPNAGLLPRVTGAKRRPAPKAIANNAQA